MIDEAVIGDLLDRLRKYPRASLALLPTPLHPLQNLGSHLGGLDLWMKRDDLTGLEGGGNKTRKLEFLVGDAIASGADMLVTVGAIQSNHTRQTAAAAAKAGLASRTNTLFSGPMLLGMFGTGHSGIAPSATGVGIMMGIIVLLELNALFGKMGPMASVRGVIHCSVGLVAVMWAVLALV